MTAGIRRHGALVAVLVAAVLASSCAAGRAFNRGQQAAARGDWELASAQYTKAVQAAPNRSDYKIFLQRAMIEAARVRLERARDLEAKGELENAIVEYRRVLEFNPANREALDRATELEKVVRDRLEASRPRPAIEQMKERARRQAEPPPLNPASRAPLRVKFAQASTQDILNFIGQATGINVTYEREFRPQPYTIDLEGVTLEEALNQIMLGNQLWYKVINERTILVITENTAKRLQYEDQVIRTFYVSHADPQELVQLLTTVTRVAGAAIQPSIAVNKSANTITIRATKGMADIVEKLIDANDRPRAEVIVDVEILEVSRARAKQYGLNLSQYQVGTIFSPEERPSSGTSDSTGGLFNLNTISQGISTADFYMTVPQAVVRFLASDSSSRQIAKPQLRGMEGEKLTLNLGDEIPVPSTVYTPIATGGAAINPLTSFSYRPVGVNIEMTPRVTYEGDIVLQIAIESSNLGESVNVAGQSLPTFGSRKVSTRLRLREGESNLLAGLVSERDRKTLKGFPGIMNMPFLRQLLSDNDTSSQQSDIVMLLTPRIVRTHGLTDRDLAPIYIGTQQNLGLTTAPTLISTVPDAPPEAAPPAAATRSVPQVGPAAAGMPAAPAAAPGMPSPATSAAPGLPRPAETPGAPARLPEGTTSAPVTPPGASPIPGTTTAPPPAVAPATPVPPQPQAQVPAEPAAPQLPAAPAQPPAGAQIVLSSPSNEFRLGGGPYTIPVSITGASRVSTVSVSIAFNPQLVRVRSVQEGSFLRQGGVTVAFEHRVDAAAGRIEITLTRSSDSTGASGAGLLAAILLEPAAEGSLTLSASGIATTPQGAPVVLSFVPVAIAVR